MSDSFGQNIDKSYYDRILKFLEDNKGEQDNTKTKKNELKEDCISLFNEEELDSVKSNDSFISIFENFIEDMTDNESLEVSIGKFFKTNTSEKNSSFSEYNSSEWEDIEAEADKILGFKTGSYTYTTSDGTTIKLEDTEGVIIRQNKRTGELVIIGAKDAKIKTKNEDVNINIFDSDIASFESKGGNDNVYIENSTVDKINTGKGNDNITIQNSEVNSIDSAAGIDNILIENSTVNKKVEGGADEDFIYSNNSNISELEGNFGNDEILIEKSTVDIVEGGTGDDTVVVNNSSQIGTIKGNMGADVVNLIDSKASTVDGGMGNDSYINENSTVSKIVNVENQGDGNIINPPNGGDEEPNLPVLGTSSSSEVNPYEEYSESTINVATIITSNILDKYGLKDLSAEEEIQVLAIDYFASNLENMQKAFSKQENEDGKLADGYNWIKELIDLGVTKDDIQKAIKEQEKMVTELTNALKGKSNSSFEEVFKKWTGIDFNQENFIEYQETSQLYSLAMNGITKTNYFKDSVAKSNNLQEVLDSYTQYYGSQERALEKLNDDLSKTSNMTMSPDERLFINDNLEVEVRTFNEKTGEYETLYTTSMDDPLIAPYGYSMLTSKIDSISKIEEELGVSFSDLQNKMKTSQLETFGKSNSFQKLIDKYCAEQEGFAKAISTAGSTIGIGMMVVGGVMCCFPATAGAGYFIMNTGKYTALASTFSDNAIGIIDDLASEKGLSKDEAVGYLKESIIEIASLYCGQKINSIAGTTKDIVFDKTQSYALAFLSEIGTDASLSLLSDMALTGNIDLTGEGISQLLGVITGIAGAKVDAYTKSAFESAEQFIKNGNIDDAYEFLKNRGVPKKSIFRKYKDLEISKIVDFYKNTGDYSEVLNLIKESKVLSYDSTVAGLEITKLLDDIVVSENVEAFKVADDLFKTDGVKKAQSYLKSLGYSNKVINSHFSHLEVDGLKEIIANSSDFVTKGKEYIENCKCLSDEAKKKLISAFNGLSEYQYQSAIINGSLRNGSTLSKQLVEALGLEDQLFFINEGYDLLATKVEEPTTVYRTVFNSDKYVASWEIGEVVSEKGYTSTCRNPNDADAYLNQQYKNQEPVNIEIRIPPGAEVVMSANMTETIINKGSSFKVVGYDPETNTYIWELIIEE